jgi:hypothetical protein
VDEYAYSHIDERVAIQFFSRLSKKASAQSRAPSLPFSSAPFDFQKPAQRLTYEYCRVLIATVHAQQGEAITN